MIKFGKIVFRLDAAIGEVYGSLFDVVDQKLVLIDEACVEDTGTSIAFPTSDNRHLIDDSGSQHMTQEEILKLKGEGILAKVL